LGSDFLDMTPKTQTIEAKVDKWGHIKLKKLCTAKKIIEWRDNYEWEKVFANYNLIKGKYPKYVRNLNNWVVRKHDWV
jgi:hypothetical protein